MDYVNYKYYLHNFSYLFYTCRSIKQEMCNSTQTMHKTAEKQFMKTFYNNTQNNILLNDHGGKILYLALILPIFMPQSSPQISLIYQTEICAVLCSQYYTTVWEYNGYVK